MSDLTIGFVGLGLIGGSIAKSIKRVFPNYTLASWCRNPKTVEEAVFEGIIDIPIDEIGNAFFKCDYIFLCTPVDVNDEYLIELKKYINKDCIITDVGSVKSSIHNVVNILGLENNFIGGHPMTGSEKTGLKNSTPFLFENAYYAITPTSETKKEKLDEFKNIILGIGGVPIIMDYSLHDYIVAGVSHLPHIIASSLVNLVRDSDNDELLMKQIAAGGFKDITRIASSSPVMWEQICRQNKDNIISLMDNYIESLEKIKIDLSKEDFKEIYKLFEDSKEYRDSIDEKSYGPIKKSYAVYCDIADETGAIKNIACILADNGISLKNIGIIHNREFEEGVLKIEFYSEESALSASDVLASNNYNIHKR